ncbi:MAG TPA: response regulator transcription factor [Chloroflexia bacterium]|nr:response regulator transcription factor [Chloroflexia bacterium]
MAEPVVTSGTKILIIEDEESIWSLVKSYLEREGFAVEVATDGKHGLELARKHRPALVILDLMLPGMDGLEVCRILRAESPVYILMLTARTDEVDRVVGLTMGADDYVTKPFSPRELVARVKAALRRQMLDSAGSGPSAPAVTAPPSPKRLEFAALVVEPESRQVWVKSQLLDLTRTEFDLLLTLAEMPNRVFSREKLLETVWGYDYFGDERVVDVHIGQLRKKLEAAGGGQPIKTVWGVGYRFEPPEVSPHAHPSVTPEKA